MTIFWQNIGISLVIVIGGIGIASAQSATVKLDLLVETSARRLTLAKQVAFAKWDARSQVEDPALEVDVIMAAVKAGQSRGLDRDFVSNFFKAQIEANKLVQCSLLASWHRAGSAPFHPAINLTTVRARLDRLQEDLISELADTAALRTGTACQAGTARAVGKYVAIHKLDDPRVRRCGGTFQTAARRRVLTVRGAAGRREMDGGPASGVAESCGAEIYVASASGRT